MRESKSIFFESLIRITASIGIITLFATTGLAHASSASRFLDAQEAPAPTQSNQAGRAESDQRSDDKQGSDGRPPQQIRDMELNPDLYQGTALFPGYRGFIAHDEEDGGALTKEEMEARIDAMARRALIQRGQMGLTLNDLRLGVMFQLMSESPDPATIRMLRELIKETERAKNEDVAPEPVSQIKVIDKGLHSEPIKLTTTYGYVSEITFIDAAGNPWPYRDKILGNNRDFSIVESGDEEIAQNKLLFSTINRYRGTNFKVVLDGFDVAVTFQVVYDDTIYHDSLVVQVDGLHSKSEATLVSGGISPLKGGEALQNLAINIPPPEDYAKRVKTNVSEKVAQVFRTKDGELLIRTRNSMLLPSSPQGVWNGPGGYSAYRIGYWPIVQLADNEGRRIDVIIDK